ELIEVRPLAGGRRVAPWIGPSRLRRGVPRSGLLPLGFGREPLARVACVCVCLVRADVAEGTFGVDGCNLGERAHREAVTCTRPVAGQAAALLEPTPALLGPELG